GANDTVCVWPAATVTRRLTLIAWPLGDVTIADRSPVWGVPAWLVTSPFNVNAAVDTSAASSCTTCTLLRASGPEVWTWIGNWKPVLLSGGICVQSTLSSVNIEFGLLG